MLTCTNVDFSFSPQTIPITSLSNIKAVPQLHTILMTKCALHAIILRLLDAIAASAAREGIESRTNDFWRIIIVSVTSSLVTGHQTTSIIQRQAKYSRENSNFDCSEDTMNNRTKLSSGGGVIILRFHHILVRLPALISGHKLAACKVIGSYVGKSAGACVIRTLVTNCRNNFDLSLMLQL